MLQYYESYYQRLAKRHGALRISTSENRNTRSLGYPPGTATQVGMVAFNQYDTSQTA